MGSVSSPSPAKEKLFRLFSYDEIVNAVIDMYGYSYDEMKGDYPVRLDLVDWLFESDKGEEVLRYLLPPEETFLRTETDTPIEEGVRTELKVTGGASAKTTCFYSGGEPGGGCDCYQCCRVNGRNDAAMDEQTLQR